jgi:hypothetical protein
LKHLFSTEYLTDRKHDITFAVSQIDKAAFCGSAVVLSLPDKYSQPLGYISS